MIRRLLALLVGIGMLLVAVLPAPTQTADVIRGPQRDPTESRHPAPPTKDLIGSLGTGDFQDRERATLQLSAQGIAVLPELKAALEKTSNPEAADRLEKLIDRIGVKHLFEPTRITLKLNNATPRTALQELTRVSGYPFTIPLESPKVNSEELLSLDVRDQPLWEVLRSINNQSGSEAHSNDSGVMFLGDPDSVKPFVDVHGPFRIVLDSIHLNCSQSFTRPKNGHFQPVDYQCLMMRLDSEPKLHLLNLSRMKLTSAIDNLGNNLLQATDAMEEWERLTTARREGHSRRHSEVFAADLHRKDRAATEIANLRGVAKVVVVRAIRTDIAVEKLQTVAKRTYRGKTFTLELEHTKVDYKGNGLVAEFTLIQNHDERYDKLESRALPVRIIIENDNGDKADIELVSLAQPGLLPVPGPDHPTSSVRYKLFAHAPAGVKAKSFTRLKILDYVCIEKEIAFSFKNIPLP